MQLLNAQKVADDAAARLKSKDQKYQNEIEVLKNSHSKLLDEICRDSQEQGNLIIEKIDELRTECLTFRKPFECFRKG